MRRIIILKYLVLFVVAATTFFLFYQYPAPADRILNIQNYFITVSGIISGIVIAYLAAKLFNIKQERENRQLILNKLSKKLTSFRRVLYCIIKSYNFWVEYDKLKQFKREFADLNYQRLHKQGTKTDALKAKYYAQQDDLQISDTTVDLFLAMEAIYGEGEFDTFGDWVFSPNIHFNYSIEELERMSEPANQIWYYLEGRYGKHTEGLINEKGISKLHENNLYLWVSEIDPKFQMKDFDRRLIGDIANEFYTTYIPHLIQLTERNQASLPKSFNILFWNLITIFGIGVIFPLFIQCVSLSNSNNIALTLSAVGIIVVAFVNLIFDFYIIMNREIHPIN